MNTNLSDKELMEDMLTSQKHITSNYSLFANECSTQNIRSDVMNIMKEEHEIQACVFDFMSSKGWYAPAAAEQQKIDQAKQKYSNVNFV